MSQSSQAPALKRLLERIIAAEQILIEIVVVAMALLICAEVICRSFLGFSLMFTDEVAGYFLVAIVFLGMPVALAKGSLFRVELLLVKLAPRAVNALQFFFDLMSLGVALILLRALVRLTLDSWQRGVRAPTVLATPLYIPQAFMVIGMTTLVLVLLLHLIRDVENIRSGRSALTSIHTGSIPNE